MVSVNLQFLINGIKYNLPIPYDADFPTAINRSVVDFENIGQRKGDFTKTIKIQANQEVNKVLQSLFVPYVSQNSAEVLSIKGDSANVLCELLINGVVHISGYCKVKSAASINKPTAYEITVFSGMNDWADYFSENKLNTLSLGETVWDFDTIKDSNSYDKCETANPYNQVYPLIEYGDIGNKAGSYAAIMDYEFRAAVWVRAMVKQAFLQAGYNLTSDWLDNVDTRKLIYPFVSGNWKRPQYIVDRYSCRANWNATQIMFAGGLDLAINPQVVAYNPSGQITLNTPINYDLPPVYGGMNVTENAFTFTAVSGGNYSVVMDLFISGASSTNNIFNIEIYKGTGVLQPILSIGSITVIGLGTSGYTFNGNIINCQPGELISVVFLPFNSGSAISIVNILSGSSISFTAIDDIEIGGVYDLAYTLPDRTIMEFIQGLTLLFNLVFDTDPLAKSVRIESMFDWVDSSGATVNGYYLGTSDAIDYSEKLQKHLEWKMEFLSKYKQQLFFQYKDDSSDGILSEREKRTQHKYGGYRHNLYKRFQKGIQAIKNPHFAATYMAYRDVEIIGGGGYGNLLLPIISPEFTSAQDTPTYKAEPRILRWQLSDHDSYFANSSGNYHYEFTMRNSIDLSVIEYTGVCPRAFSCDVDGESTYSLNFNDMEAADETDLHGLFWRFWAKVTPMINEGVKGTGVFKYLEIDNINLNFRNLLYIDSVYWIVNKVMDYKPQEQTFTKIELLLKNELGKDDIQQQEDGADGWANPSDAATSGEELDFNINSGDKIYLEDGSEVTSVVGKSIVPITTIFTKAKPKKA